MLTVIPGRDRRGCLVRVWQCLRVAAILYLLLIVLVRELLLGGMIVLSPVGGTVRVMSIRRILSLLPVRLTQTYPAFPSTGKPRVGLEAHLYRVMGDKLAGTVTESDTLDLRGMGMRLFKEASDLTAVMGERFSGV